MRVTGKLKVLGLAAICVAGMGSVMSLVRAADEAKPKHTIKEVMKVAHGKDSTLLKNIIADKGTTEEKQQLLDLYISMFEGKPAKGDEDSWKMLAGKAALAAAKVVVGRDGATKELETATNCKACHSVHKG